MSLPLTINPGDVGHIQHHQGIHTLLNPMNTDGTFTPVGYKSGLAANLPAASASNKGWVYYSTDVNVYQWSDGSVWRQWAVTSAANTWSAIQTFNADVYFKSGRPWASLRAYQAVGDGNADDTTVISNWMLSGQSLLYAEAGTYKNTGITVSSSGLMVFGAGRDATTFKYTGGAGSCFNDTVGRTRNVFWNFGIDISGGTGGAGTANAMRFQLGINDSVFEDLLIVSGTAAQHGIWIQGSNAGVANGLQFFNRFLHVSAAATGTAGTGSMFYGNGADLNNARYNNNYYQQCNIRSFTIGIRINGQGNCWVNCNFETPTGVLLEGNSTFNNLSMVSYYDSPSVVTPFQINTPATLVNVVVSIADVNVSSDSAFVMQNPPANGLRSYSMVNANVSLLSNSTQFSSLTDVSQAQLLGAGNAALAIIQGGNSPLSGRLILSGRDYANVINAVSPGGGSSVSLNSTGGSGAEWRIVTTSDGSNYSIVLRVDVNGIMSHFNGIRPANVVGPTSQASLNIWFTAAGGAPGNASGSNGDWCFAPDGRAYLKTAGAWVTIIPYQQNVQANASLSFGAIGAGATAELAFSVTGPAATGWDAYAAPEGSPESGIIWSARADVGAIRVRLANVTAGSITPAARVYRMRAVQH